MWSVEWVQSFSQSGRREAKKRSNLNSLLLSSFNSGLYSPTKLQHLEKPLQTAEGKFSSVSLPYLLGSFLKENYRILVKMTLNEISLSKLNKESRPPTWWPQCGLAHESLSRCLLRAHCCPLWLLLITRLSCKLQDRIMITVIIIIKTVNWQFFPSRKVFDNLQNCICIFRFFLSVLSSLLSNFAWEYYYFFNYESGTR